MDIPILFISARSSDDDMVIALNIGGDDYITKPYSLNVLHAKVKVVLKRYERSAERMNPSVRMAPSLLCIWEYIFRYFSSWKH